MDHLTTEQQNPDSSRLDEMSAREIVALMNANDSTIAAAVAAQQFAIAESIELIANRFQNGGRLFYVGAGTSGRLGVLDASECPPTFRTPPEMVVGMIAGGPPALTRAIEGAEDDPAQGAADLASHNFTAKDILVGIATSGRTPYVLGAMQHARQVGASVIGLTCNRESEMEQHADTMIAVVVGPEIISGSTRLKSGTVTKLVLNMLSTGAMVLLGKTYGNLMIDLRATNSKLMDRSIRIVCQLTNATAETAREKLNACEGSVKQAVVAIRGNVSPERASELLNQTGGRLRIALSSFETAQESAREYSSTLYIGVDGGGSKTSAVVGKFDDPSDSTSLQVLGQGTAGPGNPVSCGLNLATSNILSAIQLAFADAQLNPGKVASACLGLAGTGDPEIRKYITALLREKNIADNILVTDDIRPVLESARYEFRKEFRTKPPVCIGLIAGTGSIAATQTADGNIIRSGGWGPLLGDEGSGYAIAMSGLRAVCRAVDGRATSSPMLDALQNQLKLAGHFKIKHWIYDPSTEKKEIAALAGVVFYHYESDETAAQIIACAAEELAGLVTSLYHRLQPNNGNWLLAMSGGLLIHQPVLRQKLFENLDRLGCTPTSTILVNRPAIGGLGLALSEMKPG